MLAPARYDFNACSTGTGTGITIEGVHYTPVPALVEPSWRQGLWVVGVVEASTSK